MAPRDAAPARLMRFRRRVRPNGSRPKKTPPETRKKGQFLSTTSLNTTSGSPRIKKGCYHKPDDTAPDSLLARISDDLAPYSVVEQSPLMEGKQMVMVFGPKKK